MKKIQLEFEIPDEISVDVFYDKIISSMDFMFMYSGIDYSRLEIFNAVVSSHDKLFGKGKYHIYED